MTLRTISYGGGVQSTALLVLAAQDMLPGFEMPGGEGCDSGYCWT